MQNQNVPKAQAVDSFAVTPGLTSTIQSQVGHQAAQCTNGTINWKGIYGEEAFILKEPLYHSDYTRMAEEKKVDLQDLEARATEYAKVRKRVCRDV